MTTDTGSSSVPPSGAAATVDNAPAANPPAAAAPAESESTETTTHKGRVSSWVLGGIAVLGLIGIGVLFMRRQREERVSIYEENTLPGTRTV